MSAEINLKNIKSFLQGNLRYYVNKVKHYPEHIREQYRYRLYTCKDTCLKTGLCENCGCPTVKKAFASEACSDKFPDFMTGHDWSEYKKANKIDIEEINKTIKEIENDL